MFVQFNAFIAIVKEMMSQVESEHRTKLEQLNSLQQENRFVAFVWKSELLTQHKICRNFVVVSEGVSHVQ